MKKTVYLVDDSTFTKCVQESTSICQALRLMNLSFKGRAYSTFRKRCADLQLDISHFVSERKTKQNLTQQDIESACETSISRRQALLHLSLHPESNGNIVWIDMQIAKFNIPIDHWLGMAHLHGKTHNWNSGCDLKDILVKDSLYRGGGRLKNKLIKNGLLKPLCAKCGIDTWHGQKLSLQLDHENGHNTDNRIENLRLLCPNCHSLTPTYCRGANKINRTLQPKSPPKPRKQRILPTCQDCARTISPGAERCKPCTGKRQSPTKIVWPSNEELTQMLESSNFSTVARKLGVSDNAIRNRLRRS